MQIAATGSSSYANITSLQTRPRPASQPDNSGATSEPAVNQQADADLNEKVSALSKIQTAFKAALSVNGSLEGILQPIV